MMFKTLLAKMGKGGAQIDLVLEQDHVRLGDPVKGKLVIRGGIIEQKIKKIDIDLMIHIRIGQRVYSHSIAQFPFHSPFLVHPSEVVTFPFSYQLPSNLLVSGYTVSYQFITHLDIVAGTNYTDTDPMIITPPHYFQQLLNALEQLGFHEKYGSRSYDGMMQSFEFTPTSFLKKEVKEMEFVAAIGNDTISLFLQLFHLASPKLVSCREISLKRELLNRPDQLKAFLLNALEEMVENPEQYQESKDSFYNKYTSTPGAIGAFAGEWFPNPWLKNENPFVKDESLLLGHEKA
ncbi:sporulation protein [Thermoactinomyces sp. AMNI-1]|uniref:Sporulation protein n=2 Tax=Thermoactinomyces mirandus TaxID=2756294 RepID=A0A7W2AQR8_9BACL|nr:sporulation protein [Thermoactinomyces mirandus]